MRIIRFGAPIRKCLPFGVSVLINGILCFALLRGFGGPSSPETELAVTLQSPPAQKQVSTALPPPPPRIRALKAHAESIIKQEEKPAVKQPIFKQFVDAITPSHEKDPDQPEEAHEEPSVLPDMTNPTPQSGDNDGDPNHGDEAIITAMVPAEQAAGGNPGGGGIIGNGALGEKGTGGDTGNGVAMAGSPGGSDGSASGGSPRGDGGTPGDTGRTGAGTPQGSGDGAGTKPTQPSSTEQGGGEPQKAPSENHGKSGVTRKDPAQVHSTTRYPAEARDEGIEGTVQVRVTVGSDGTVKGKPQLVKSSGYAILDKAALRDVKSWRFLPAMDDGEPHESTTVVKVVYSLK